MKYLPQLPCSLPDASAKKDHQELLSPVHSFPLEIINPCDIFQYQRPYNFYIFFLQTILLLLVSRL